LKKVLLGLAAVLVLLVAGAAAAVPFLEKHAAARLKADIESGGAATVETVEVSLFSRRVEMSNLRNPQATGVSAARWSASGIAWPLADLLTGRVPFDGLRLGDPLRADRIEASDLTLSDDAGNTWKFGRLVLEGVDLARYDAELGMSPYRFASLGARVLQALSIRRLEEHDVVFNEGLGGSGFTVDALALDNVEHGRIGSASMTNLRMGGARAGAPSFSVAETSATGLDFRRILAPISSPSWYFGSPLGRLGLEKVSATGFGGELLTRYGISLGSVTADFTPQSEKVVRGRSRIEGFVLAPPLRGLEALQIRLALTAMGLKEVRLGFDCSGLEDRAKGEITIDHCALSGPDLAEIDFTARLVNVDEPFWQAMDSGDYSLARASKVSLGGARLVLSDKSLLDRSLKAVAATAGQPPAQVRSQFAQEVRRFQPAGVLITEDLTKLLDTVARFIEQGGTLTIEAQPDPPFGLDRAGYFMTPGPDLINLLGITAKLSR
jgi:hypothetical protein